MGSKLGVKIDEKSIQKWSQEEKASWHRFLMDFGGFGEASWEGKSSQDIPRQGKAGQDRTRQDKTKTKTRQDKILAEKVSGGLFAPGVGGGITPLLGGYFPRGQDPWGHGSLGPLVATFLPCCCASFFHRFFDAFFDRF